MQCYGISYDKIPQFSKIDVAYQMQNPNLSAFYEYEPSLEAFEQVIEARKKNPFNRTNLVQALRTQYADFQIHENLSANINALQNEDTFTITTAHQPSLFLSPLFFIYKIISVLSLVNQLNTHYKNYKFIPVYVMGADDHDFEELNHAHIFGKKIAWQTEQKGAIGLMTNDGLSAALAELKTLLGESENAVLLYSIFENAYLSRKNFAEANLQILHDFFGKDGLVVINPLLEVWKKQAIPLFEKELFEQISNPIITQSQEKLNSLGYKYPVFARDINLFYLGKNFRERIVLEGNEFKVLNQNIVFSREQLLHELHENPSKFSPNVVMRPLFQEAILPNLAYIGGGGEIAYWLERKSQFKQFGIHFPMLIRRDSAWVIDSNQAKKMDLLAISLEEWFEDEEKIIKNYVTKLTDENLLSLQHEKQQMETIFNEIKEKAKQIDATLEAAISAELAKALNNLEALEQKIFKAEKRKNDISLQQIRSIKQKYFPNNSLQERYEHFIPFFLQHGFHYFQDLKTYFNPLDKSFKVLIYK